MQNLNGPKQEAPRWDDQSSPCEAMWLLLSLYADGEVSNAERAQVDEHVAICSHCAEDLRFMASTSAVIAAAPEVAPPPTLREAIFAQTINRRTFAQRFADSARRAFAVPQVRLGTVGATAAAAALMFAMVHGGVTPRPVVTDQTSHPTPDLAEAPSEPSVVTPGETASAPEAVAAKKAESRRKPESSHVQIADNRIPPSVIIPVVAKSVSKPTAKNVPGRSIARPADYKSKPFSSQPFVDMAPDGPAADFNTPDPMAKAPAPTTAQPSVPSAPPVIEPVAAPRPTETHIRLMTASAGAMSPDQVASLAGIKQSLKQQPVSWATGEVRQAIRDKQIRIDLVRGKF